MSKLIVDELNETWGLEDELWFEINDDGLILAQINNKHAKATISLFGGQVLTYQPHGEEPLLWLSPGAILNGKKAIRGGVPICWPWFGPHPHDSNQPAHGYIRTRHGWEVTGREHLEDGSTTLWIMQREQGTESLWPHDWALSYVINVGKQLKVNLITSNEGKVPFTFSTGLHTYLQVGDARKITISGLDGCKYLDKVDKMAEKVQRGEIRLEGEVDRVYLATSDIVRIVDPELHRVLVTEKHGSNTTVVWHPGAEKARGFADIPVGSEWNMVCVEAVNALEDAVTLAPGEQYSLQALYYLEKMAG
jgi:glucose-6-phosphate 1-epimerase